MENEKTDNKARILEVSEKLFAQKGFNGVSIDEISKEAEINKSMIYYYFSSKEGLLVNIIQKHINEFDLILAQFQITEVKHIRDIVKQIITLAADYISKNRNIISILHHETFMTREKSKTDIINFINPLWNKIETVLHSRFPEIGDTFILDKLICISLLINFNLILERLDCESQDDYSHMKKIYIERITDIIEMLLVKKARTGRE